MKEDTQQQVQVSKRREQVACKERGRYISMLQQQVDSFSKLEPHGPEKDQCREKESKEQPCKKLRQQVASYEELELKEGQMQPYKKL